MKTRKILAWHFAKDDGYLSRDLSHLKAEPGLILTVDPDKLELCDFGLHASVKAIDALYYAPGATVCRVELSGRIIEGNDKIVASERKIIAVADATRTLHEFAIWCAEQALDHIDDPDPRSLEALRIKRLWLDGNATDGELDAASDAAWDVVDAATDIAMAVAATVAAMAAMTTATTAAWDATTAAWDATTVATAKQNQQLEAMLAELLDIELNTGIV